MILEFFFFKLEKHEKRKSLFDSNKRLVYT